ncbi:MAG: hypothetical protein BroJett011_08070 [Chloroflexota bacterium]|nr:MAG: hypothetical protein BroJett011_08070 [Chloroflexota bacterium]
MLQPQSFQPSSHTRFTVVITGELPSGPEGLEGVLAVMMSQIKQYIQAELETVRTPQCMASILVNGASFNGSHVPTEETLCMSTFRPSILTPIR